MDVLQRTRVTSAFQKDEFGIAALVALKIELEASLQRQQLAERAKHTATSVAGDWGLYSPQPPHENLYYVALKQLQSAGEDFVFAVRNKPFTKIKAAFAEIRKLQNTHADQGADDTEGREILWELTQFACEGTAIDPQKLWDQCYA